MNEKKRLKTYLKRFGLSDQGIDIYLELFAVGPTTALKLSRSLKIPRTKVYRELESLQEVALVSADKLRYGSVFRALPLDGIEAVIESRKASIEGLAMELPVMVQSLRCMVGGAGDKATIRNYHGIAGLRQANWNLTKAEREFRVFETKHISHHLDRDFARRLRNRIVERGLVSFDLTNQKRVQWSELEPLNKARCHYRYIDPRILEIRFEMYIYDDTVTLLDYSKHQQMAVEISHPQLSTMMTQLFDAVWRTAEVVVPE